MSSTYLAGMYLVGLVLPRAGVLVELRRLSLSGVLSSLLGALPLDDLLLGLLFMVLLHPAAFSTLSSVFLWRPGERSAIKVVSKGLIDSFSGPWVACTGSAAQPPGA